MREGLFRALIASAAAVAAAAALPEPQLQYHIRKPLRNPSTMTTAIERFLISQLRAHALRLSRVSTLQLNLHQLQKQCSLRMRLKISKQKMDVSTIARLSNLTMHMIVVAVAAADRKSFKKISSS
uniref:Uncharacterized protein n=1 Tax=Trichogramma kaykai TaxID=54128 RepID=A0ABD2VT30_9HYME